MLRYLLSNRFTYTTDSDMERTLRTLRAQQAQIGHLGGIRPAVKRTRTDDDSTTIMPAFQTA